MTILNKTACLASCLYIVCLIPPSASAELTVVEAIENARAIEAYNLDVVPEHVYRNRQDSLSLKHGVFHGYPILEPAKRLTAEQFRIAQKILTNPDAHALRLTRGDPRPEFGLVVLGENLSVDVIINLGQRIWSFDWVDEDGIHRRTSSRFDAVAPELLKLVDNVYPMPFGDAPPMWRTARGNSQKTNRDDLGQLPSEFGIEDLQIEILTQSKIWSMRLRVAGTGRVEMNRTSVHGDVERKEFDIEPNQVVGLLERLYRMDFFGMKDDYSLLLTLYLDDGEVMVTEQPDYAILKVRVCCKIGEIEKCTIATAGEPQELVDFVRMAYGRIDPDGRIAAMTPERRYRELSAEVVGAIASAQEAVVYKVDHMLSVNYRNSPSKLEHGVFLDYPILGPGKRLTPVQLDRLRDMFINPEAHLVYDTRGSLGPDFGVAMLSASDTIKVLIDFAENMWIHEGVDADGDQQRTWSRFDVVEFELFAMMSELYPQPEFGADPPSWAAKRPPPPPRPGEVATAPVRFALADVQIETILQTRDWVSKTWLNGSGKATSTQQPKRGASKTKTGVVTPQNLVKLLQDLYRMDFFGRNEELRVARLRLSDGRVSVTSEPRYSVGKVRICCKIGTFERCVRSTEWGRQPFLTFSTGGWVNWDK